MMLERAGMLVTTLALLSATFGCGTENGTNRRDNDPSGEAGTSGTSGGGNECSAGSCGGCQDCFSTCYCQTSNMDGCVSACRTGAAGNGGAAGTGQPGSGGTGTGTGGTGTGGTGTGTGGTGTGGTGTGTGGTGTGTGGTGTGTGGAGGAGGSGIREIRLTMSPFTVGAGVETFRCQNFKNPLGGQDIIFNKTESFMAQGSHHMFVFEQSGVTADGPLESESSTCNGLQFNTLVHSAQTPQVSTTYPPGVGVKMHGNMGFRIISLYFNPTNAPLTTQVSIVLYLVDAASIQSYAASLFANTLGTTIRPNSTATWGGTCRIPREANLLFAVSHMHSHATHFIARTNTGQTIYETTEWDEPAAAVFQPSPGASLPPLKIAANGSITYQCQYNNTSAQSLQFCESAKDCEMCILTARYFPAPDGAPISCLF